MKLTEAENEGRMVLQTDFKGHRERVAWHKKLKGRDNFKADSEGRREPAVRMNTEGEGQPLARAAAERLAMPAGCY